MKSVNQQFNSPMPSSPYISPKQGPPSTMATTRISGNTFNFEKPLWIDIATANQLVKRTLKNIKPYSQPPGIQFITAQKATHPATSVRCPPTTNTAKRLNAS